MASLEQYIQFKDAMWVAYLMVNSDEKRVRENILALEAAYARIDKLKWDIALDKLLEDDRLDRKEEDGQTM